MPRFVPSLELNASFYKDAVAGVVERWPHSAALIGWGSDVLGYDTARSTDHGWGPRLQILVDAQDVEAVRHAIDAGLPERFSGWPVYYGWNSTPTQHHVQVNTAVRWLESHLGFNPIDGVSLLDWLLTPQQLLLGIVRGAVYHDGLDILGKVRRDLCWYPEELWPWLLACQWRRIAQEEAFVGRAAEVGDDLGSRVAAARLVRELMRLCFLLKREYWPYTKWFGTAFARLELPASLGPALLRATEATTYGEREAALVDAYETVARLHNATGVTPPVDPSVRHYHGREFLVLMADRFVDTCLERVSDESLTQLPLIGSIDQLVDSTDLLSYPRRVVWLRTLYERAVGNVA